MSGYIPPPPDNATPQQQASYLEAVADSNRFGQVSQNVGNARIIDNSGASWNSGEWWQQLQPGSWRGVGFVLDAGQTAAGRRVAIHEYPYRDETWAEDLGKLPRRFTVQAFLVGDDVYQQRDAMLGVIEQSGVGTLVHPTLGSLQCVLLEFSVTDRRERGRFVELQFSFILAGDVKYPSTSIATADAVEHVSALPKTAAQQELEDIYNSMNPPAVAVASVPDFSGLAVAAVQDAALIAASPRGMQGNFGRFANGNRSTMQSRTADIQFVLANSTVARTAVETSAATLIGLAAQL